MKNSLWFKSGRAAALASMCGISLVLPLQRTLAAAAFPAASENAPDEALAFLEMFWTAAWGLDFVAGQSGMILSESLPGNSWVVLVGDSSAENLIVAEGVFVQTSQEFLDYLAWPQERLDEAGIINVDHYFVAGTVYGSTGFESAVVVMLQEILAPGENQGDPPIMARVLSPFELADDEDAADEEVGFLASLFYATGDICLGDLDPPAGGGPTSGQTPANCAAIHDLCDDACWDRFIAESIACGAGAVVCIAAGAFACAGAAIGYAFCWALWSAVCVVAEGVCLGLTHAHYKFCRTQCQIAHMGCDPDYSPPCFEVLP